LPEEQRKRRERGELSSFNIDWEGLAQLAEFS